MSHKCPNCNTDNPDTQSYCGVCGTKLGTPEDIPFHKKTLETPFPQFSPGTSLAGRYEIIKELGKGGMGEVYLAEDTNLKRQVAIKVLPKAFAFDDERLARFEREARVLASLNHPNIATIHGLEKEDGQQLLVMELVEGETLAERIEKGPLSLEETLDVSRQIAEGLESAHEKGVIHRDLKPGNIKLTPEGAIKILDFGLAKAYQEEPEAVDLSKSPTLTDRMTQPGVILGTAAYMSPEQARSRPVDKRTDIWAFGCVLYECLTGKMAFPGETFSDTLAHILKGEPDWSKLPLSTPTSIKALLRRCLQKELKSRLRDIGDARIEMDEAESPPIDEPFSSRRLKWRWILPICTACILIGLISGFLIKRKGGGILSPIPVVSVVKTEPGYALASRAGGGDEWPTRTAMQISKDGSFIIYSAANRNTGADTIPQLFIRHLKEREAAPIPGTEGGIAPFLSPDNRWIGFWADGKLWKVLVEGGVPQQLCGDETRSFGASWGENGQIIFASGSSTGLYSIPSNGGRPEALTKPDPERMESYHLLPHFLPKGKGVLFTIMKAQLKLEPRVAILDLESREWRELLKNASDARYISTGHILCMRKGSLMAVPFDLDKVDITGQPVSVIPDVIHALNTGNSSSNTSAGQFSISESGSLVFVSGGITPDRDRLLVWVDQEGKVEPLSTQIKPYFAPRLSPDGNRVLYETLGTKRSIGKYNIDRDIASEIIIGMGASWPIFSPSGNEIVLSGYGSSAYTDIFIKSLKEDTEIKPLITSQNDKFASSFSSDGNLLAYLENRNNQWDILVYDFRDQSTTPFAATDYFERWPDFSPDGHWISYVITKDGSSDVFVRSSSGTGVEVQVSRNRGHSPLWARSGKQLFYLSNGFRQVWVCDVLDINIPSFGSPRLLFEKDENYLFASFPVRGYDISLDDNRFLTAQTIEQQPRPVTEMNLIQNWFEELKRLIPTKK